MASNKQKQIVWFERPGQIVAAIQHLDASETPFFSHLSSQKICQDQWTSSEFIGRLIQKAPQLQAWFVDVGLAQPALVTESQLAYYAKTNKLKLTEGLYLPFKVVAEEREGKGVKLQPLLQIKPNQANQDEANKNKAKTPHCCLDLRNPVKRLQHEHAVSDSLLVSPVSESALYHALKTAWLDAVEPAVGSIYIEPTTAVTTIDVNGIGEAEALNTAACESIAQVVTARNIAGQILVDFASMPTKQARLKTLETLQAAFSLDTHKLTWGGIDGFSCLLFSRQRIGASIYEQTMQPATAPETGWRCDPDQKLIDLLDDLYQQKRSQLDWAKREPYHLVWPYTVTKSLMDSLVQWMAEHAFIDLIEEETHER